ncbi:hypothetical protein ECZU34_38270 [Escherichia coli]|nr:hypothetical protein ECZU24_16050 [Escherichia coli]GHL24622.1 hypothetical protein ECZU25_14350 [Escherichia coli]GHL76079.1 hypothetical protein ECZU34_38270 [Escherichia coli]
MDCNVAAASEGVAVAAATATPAIDDVSAGAALAGKPAIRPAINHPVCRKTRNLLIKPFHPL